MKIASLDDIPAERVSHDPDIPKKAMLRYGEIAGFGQFAQCMIPAGRSTAPHAHADLTEVFFVRAGRGTIRIDGAPHPAAPGTCVRVDPGETHTIENPGPDALELLYFGIPGGRPPPAG